MGKTRIKEAKAQHGAGYFFPKFEKLAVLYKKVFLEPSIETCNGRDGLEKDPWVSLRFFLLQYAFERQGRAPDYAVVAADIAANMKGKRLNADTADQVWSQFRERLPKGKDGRTKLNEKNNPLCPEGTPYSSGAKKAKGKSVVQLAAEELQGKTLVMWSRKLLEEEKVEKAYDTLRQINGVGVKIAPLFLRDVATTYGITPKQSREHLQPVDKWVKFVVEHLPDYKGPSVAKFIVDRCPKSPETNQPEKVNQGMWYFCARVAESSEYRVRRSLQDESFFKSLVTRHVDRLVADGEFASGFSSTWRDNK